MVGTLSMGLLISTMIVTGLSPGRRVTAQEESGLFGDWTGESICQVRDSPCRDEKVVYHLSNGSDAKLINISADKIVDGKAVNMGVLEFNYDKDAGKLINESHGRWVLNVRGKTIEGTLTLADGKLYRKLMLTKKGS